MDLKQGEVHIWRYTLDEREYKREALAPLLSEKERQRCGEYLNEAEKIRYTCNHRFVRRVLAGYLNTAPAQLVFSRATMGKPYIKDSGLFFSYSYRTTFCLLAISKLGEVGVDIEKIKILQDLPTFAAFSFSEKEREILFKNDRRGLQDRLFTFWTFKEAIIKALGVGLNADLTQIDLSPFLENESNPLPFDNHAIYTLKQIPADPGYKAAFAVKGKVSSFAEFTWDEIGSLIE